MQIRDRIQDLRRVAASSLRPHPQNWRKHPPEQQDALRGVLAEIGYADALLVRELDDGSLQLIDGHLRAETTPEAIVPVLVLDVSAQEAEKILLTHDPLCALADVDHEQYQSLGEKHEFVSSAVEKMLSEAATATQTASEALSAAKAQPDAPIPESFQVVVECEDEADQQQVYEQMSQEGRRCRVLTLG